MALRIPEVYYHSGHFFGHEIFKPKHTNLLYHPHHPRVRHSAPAASSYHPPKPTKPTRTQHGRGYRI